MPWKRAPATLQARGITLVSAADESSTGPASLMLIDPDGNPILIDQHVPKPQPSPSSLPQPLPFDGYTDDPFSVFITRAL